LTLIKDDIKLKSWIFQISSNTVIDYYRPQKSTKPLPDWREQKLKAKLKKRW